MGVTVLVLMICALNVNENALYDYIKYHVYLNNFFGQILSNLFKSVYRLRDDFCTQLKFKCTYHCDESIKLGAQFNKLKFLTKIGIIVQYYQAKEKLNLIREKCELSKILSKLNLTIFF